MSVISLFKGWFSHRGKALALYRSGMNKAAKKEFSGAITDYSTVIDSKDAPPDVVAMATYNRALAYSAIREDHKAANDLDAVLNMSGITSEVKSAALRRKERVRKRMARGSDEQQD